MIKGFGLGSSMAFVAVLFSAAALPQTSNVDTSRGELLVPRYGPTAVSDGTWVYVYGGAPRGARNGPGSMHDGLLSLIERVDPTSLKSEYFSNGLHRRANHGSAFADGSIVSCGGRTQVGLSRGRVSSCESLDLESGTFRELPALPEPVRTLGMVAAGDDLYAVGGLTESGRYSAATVRLAPEASAWERLADMPLAREGKIVAVGRQLYAIGGYDGSAMRSVMVFDTETEQWERREDLPFGLSAHSLATDGVSIYLFGDYERMNLIHRYEPGTGALYRLDQQIAPRRHTDAVAVAGRVLVIGGNQTSAGRATTLIEAFELEDLRAGGRRIGSVSSK